MILVLSTPIAIHRCANNGAHAGGQGGVAQTRTLKQRGTQPPYPLLGGASCVERAVKKQYQVRRSQGAVRQFCWFVRVVCLRMRTHTRPSRKIASKCVGRTQGKAVHRWDIEGIGRKPNHYYTYTQGGTQHLGSPPRPRMQLHGLLSSSSCRSGPRRTSPVVCKHRHQVRRGCTPGHQQRRRMRSEGTHVDV